MIEDLLTRYYRSQDAEPHPEQAEHVASCPACQATALANDAVSDLWETEPVQAPRGSSLAAWWRSLRLPVLATSGVAAVLLVATLWPQTESRDSPLRPKGAFRLYVAVDRDGQASRLKPGAQLQTGDRLGFFYSASAPGYLTILYGSADGLFVRIHPVHAGPSEAVTVGREIRVPDGAVISPGAGCEWVVGIVSAEPMTSAEAIELASRLYATREGCRLGKLPPGDIQSAVIGVAR